MMRESRTCAPQAGAIVVDFVPKILPMIVDQASFISNPVLFFPLKQAAHQRKEQP
jgi:hypothetical protein